MDRRKTSKHSRDYAPKGTIRIRTKSGVKSRWIKVRALGRKQDKWQRVTRHVWEHHNGPVPPGKRVYCLDGDSLNDAIDNLVVMTPGEWIAHCHRLDPGMSEDNRRGQKRRKATADHNRIRGMVRRHVEFLPGQWYAVHRDRRCVDNRPYRSRRALLAVHGIIVPSNGRLPGPIPFEAMRGSDIEASEVRHFSKIGNSPTEKRGADALSLREAC